MSLIKHNPCGHWHKGPSKIPPVMPPSIKIAYAELYASGDDVDRGIGLASYNVSTNVWTYEGAVLGEGYPNDQVPGTLRIMDDSYLYYTSWQEYPSYNQMKRLYIVKDRAASHVDLWTWEHEVCEVDTMTLLNSMDCNDSGLIVCGATFAVRDSASHYCVGVRTSINGGTSFGSPYYFPDVSGGYYANSPICVRIDDTGVIWVTYFDSLRSPNPGENAIYVYKSNDLGATWSQVCKKTLLSTERLKQSICHTLDTTGRYQYIHVMYENITTHVSYWRVYKSSDYGVSFTALTDMPNTWGIKSTSYGSNLVMLYSSSGFANAVFKVSNDSGANFTDITPSVPISTGWFDIQGYGSNIVFPRDSDSGTATARILYSLNGGTTWAYNDLPVTGNFNQAVFLQGWGSSADIAVI